MLLLFRAKTVLTDYPCWHFSFKIIFPKKWEAHFVQHDVLNALLVSVMAWSCIALRAALNVWRMEVWLPTRESVHREIITSLFKLSLSSKCSSHVVPWHAPYSNTVVKQRKGRELATVVSWAVRISIALENLENAGLIAHRVTKLALGAAADTSLFLVNLNLGIWYNAFLWLAFSEGFEAAELHQIKRLQSENITCTQYLYF